MTWPFSLFHFSLHTNGWYGNIAWFALTADADGRGYRWFIWMWSVSHSLNLLTQSHNVRDDPKVIFDTIFRPNSITKWHYNFIFTQPLLFIQSFNIFEAMQNRSAKITICWRVVSCDSGRSRSRQSFTDSSSDSGQNGRLLPTPTQVSTPTPQPWLMASFTTIPGSHECLDYQALHYCAKTS